MIITFRFVKNVRKLFENKRMCFTEYLQARLWVPEL